jgi:outer membrane protein OmpA-like peptidoglycan-associated protein
MSNSVERLKELLFNTETHALEELARRIDDVSRREQQSRDELADRITTVAERETVTRQQLAQRLDGLAEGESKAREELRRRIDDVYARAGDTERMTASVADIISEALRRAEVAKHSELSQSIAPLVVSTIKTELRNSQDEMVEALYPITGRLVKSYVASAVKDLTDQMNRRLEQNPLMLRLQSLTTGRSVGELALAGTQEFDVKELYLIRRGSGELLAHWPDKPISGRDHAMSGVLAAVNEFANDAFAADQSSLRQIDLGGEEVYLRGSPTYLLVARCSGQAPKRVEQTLDDAFIATVEKQNKIDANPAVVLADLGTSLKADVAKHVSEFENSSRMGPLKILAALILLPLIGWFTWSQINDYRVAAVRSSAERIIAADPEMLGYPAQIDVDDHGHSLTISGLTPSLKAKQRIVEDIKRSLPRITLNDRLSVIAGSDIVIPDVSPDFARVRQEMAAAMTAATRKSFARTGVRASWRLKQAAADLQRVTALSIEPPAAEAIKRSSAEIEAVRTEIASLTDAPNVNQSAPIAALSLRLDAVGDDLMRAAVGDARSLPRPKTDLLSEGPALETAIEQLAASAERVAAVASTVSIAKTLKPPPAPAPPPAPVAQPSTRDKLESYIRTHAVFFGMNVEFRNPDTAAKIIRDVAELIKAAGVLVRVVGYTDEAGAQSRNLQIAQERAERVRRDLLAAGVPSGLLVTVGRSNAIDLSDVRGAQSPNRRVEFEVGFEGEMQP